MKVHFQGRNNKDLMGRPGGRVNISSWKQTEVNPQLNED